MLKSGKSNCIHMSFTVSELRITRTLETGSENSSENSKKFHPTPCTQYLGSILYAEVSFPSLSVVMVSLNFGFVAFIVNWILQISIFWSRVLKIRWPLDDENSSSVTIGMVPFIFSHVFTNSLKTFICSVVRFFWFSWHTEKWSGTLLRCGEKLKFIWEFPSS